MAAPGPSGRFVARYSDALSQLPQTPALMEDAVAKVLAGETTVAEVIEVTTDL